MAVKYPQNTWLCEQIGANIKRIRTAKGYRRQEDFAKKMEVTRKTISKWEAGLVDLSISQLEDIKVALGVEDWGELLK